MTRATFARHLAGKLTKGAWHQDQLEAALHAHLPPLHRSQSKHIAAALTTALPTRVSPPLRVVAIHLATLPAFQALYLYCKKNGLWPAPDLTPASMTPADAFAGIAIPQIPTLADLADWLLLPMDRLDYACDLSSRHEDHGETAINHYHYALLRKASGKTRLIEAPKSRLKAMQRQIGTDIMGQVPVHKDAFGFVPGRNCLTAAARHAGEEVVVCFDFEDFFPSIGFGRIFGLFRHLGYPETVARHLAGLCTTRTPSRIRQRLSPKDRALFAQSHLPQGAPTSPVLSNLIAYRLDCRLSALAKSLGASYSRYADDLTFSGDAHIARHLLRLVPKVARDEGFTLNSDKTRIMHRSTRQVVTNIVVNSHLNIPRQSYDRLKAVLHACAKPGDRRLQDAQFRRRLEGHLAWVMQVNPRRGAKLERMLMAAMVG